MQFNKPISIIDIKSFENDKGTCVSGIEQVTINDTLILKLSGTLVFHFRNIYSKNNT